MVERRPNHFLGSYGFAAGLTSLEMPAQTELDFGNQGPGGIADPQFRPVAALTRTLHSFFPFYAMWARRVRKDS